MFTQVQLLTFELWPEHPTLADKAITLQEELLTQRA